MAENNYQSLRDHLSRILLRIYWVLQCSLIFESETAFLAKNDSGPPTSSHISENLGLNHSDIVEQIVKISFFISL